MLSTLEILQNDDIRHPRHGLHIGAHRGLGNAGRNRRLRSPNRRSLSCHPRRKQQGVQRKTGIRLPNTGRHSSIRRHRLAASDHHPKPIPRWDVHCGGLEDDLKDSTAPHITFNPNRGRPAVRSSDMHISPWLQFRPGGSAPSQRSGLGDHAAEPMVERRLGGEVHPGGYTSESTSWPE